MAKGNSTKDGAALHVFSNSDRYEEAASGGRERSKARFRALREMVGLSQQDVANDLDVNVKTVKRWESPNWPDPPEDAWGIIERARQKQERILDSVRCHILSECKELPLVITYYRTQEQFEAFGNEGGKYTVANANARAVASLLIACKFDVDFRYPDDQEPRPFRKLVYSTHRAYWTWANGDGDIQ